jgi:hypothetical protein
MVVRGVHPYLGSKIFVCTIVVAGNSMAVDDDTNNDSGEPKVVMRQRLMVADSVFLYKVPPLKTSGGHRYVRAKESVRIWFVIGRSSLSVLQRRRILLYRLIPFMPLLSISLVDLMWAAWSSV